MKKILELMCRALDTKVGHYIVTCLPYRIALPIFLYILLHTVGIPFIIYAAYRDEYRKTSVLRAALDAYLDILRLFKELWR
jgi:ABC-type dipeptide/oligopeptide/nickel transport system permease component